MFATNCVCADLIQRATRFLRAILRPPTRAFTIVTFEKGKFLESFMNNLSPGFQLPLGIKFLEQQCSRRGGTCGKHHSTTKSMFLKIFFSLTNFSLLLFWNWDYGLFCFLPAGCLSIIICYESASLESRLFLLDEKSKSPMLLHCFCMNNSLTHVMKWN